VCSRIQFVQLTEPALGLGMSPGSRRRTQADCWIRDDRSVVFHSLSNPPTKVPGAFCTNLNERSWNERSLEWNEGRDIRRSRLCVCFDRLKLRWRTGRQPLWPAGRTGSLADVLPLAQGVRRFTGGRGAAGEGAWAGERQAKTVDDRSGPGQPCVEGHRLGNKYAPVYRAVLQAQ
jgi:hypothetical protein